MAAGARLSALFAHPATRGELPPDRRAARPGAGTPAPLLLPRGGLLPRPHPGVPLRPLVRARPGRALGPRPRGTPLAQAHPLRPRRAAGPARRPAPGLRRRGFLPRGRRGGARGGAWAPCTPGSSSRGTSASSATGRRSCTWRSRWATSTGAWSAPCPRARTCAACTWRRPWPGTPPSATPRPIARPWKPWPAAACRRGPWPSAASPWSWSAWPTTSGTWARWPATWASCPPPRGAGACAATP